ncbi:conserved protein of unknown function [Tenacibaculum sp. 190130A14a]|uniref:Uncharacterized protein n=1 Tax=Tenacibaculum polynesiense TaxID=3137857 RepID=A0ABP1EYH6_9FLAO
MKTSVNNLVLERGILSSVYKQEIKRNIRSMKAESLSRVKNKLKSDSSKLYSETATILKVSMFAIALVLLVV